MKTKKTILFIKPLYEKEFKNNKLKNYLENLENSFKRNDFITRNEFKDLIDYIWENQGKEDSIEIGYANVQYIISKEIKSLGRKEEEEEEYPEETEGEGYFKIMFNYNDFTFEAEGFIEDAETGFYIEKEKDFNKFLEELEGALNSLGGEVYDSDSYYLDLTVTSYSINFLNF